MYPIFIIGWGADYADPHNFLYTFMHSQGVYARFMAYNNPESDKLCTEGISNVDPAKREKIYSRLQDIWYKDAVAIALYQQIVVCPFQEYVHGYVPNPMLHPEWKDLKNLWKE